MCDAETSHNISDTTNVQLVRIISSGQIKLCIFIYTLQIVRLVQEILNLRINTQKE